MDTSYRCASDTSACCADMCCCARMLRGNDIVAFTHAPAAPAAAASTHKGAIYSRYLLT